MHRLFSIILYRENNYNSAIIEIDKAIEIFEEIGSMSGLTLCYLFKAFIRTEDTKDRSFLTNSMISDDSEAEEIAQIIENFETYYPFSGHLKQPHKLIEFKEKIKKSYLKANTTENLGVNDEFKKNLILCLVQPIISLVNDSKKTLPRQKSIKNPINRKFSDIADSTKNRTKSAVINNITGLEIERPLSNEDNNLEIIHEEVTSSHKFSHQQQNAPVASNGIDWSDQESDKPEQKVNIKEKESKNNSIKVVIKKKKSLKTKKSAKKLSKKTKLNKMKKSKSQVIKHKSSGSIPKLKSKPKRKSKSIIRKGAQKMPPL